MRRAGSNTGEGNKSSSSRQTDDTVRWGGCEATWGQPDTKLFSSPKGYYMKYVCSRTQWENDIWMTPLGIQDLQFHRLGSSSCPISFLLDRNNSSRSETEPEIRALLVDVSSSEGRTCRWVNCSLYTQIMSTSLTLGERTLILLFSLFDHRVGVLEKGCKLRWIPNSNKLSRRANEQSSSSSVTDTYQVVSHHAVPNCKWRLGPLAHLKRTLKSHLSEMNWTRTETMNYLSTDLQTGDYTANPPHVVEMKTNSHTKSLHLYVPVWSRTTGACGGHILNPYCRQGNSPFCHHNLISKSCDSCPQTIIGFPLPLQTKQHVT